MSFYKLIKTFSRIASCGNIPISNSKVILCGCQNYSLKTFQPIKKPENPDQKKKKPLIPKITLLSGDALTVTTLEEAQKLAKRRDLKLVKIVDLDVKTDRPVYRLMTGTEYHAEDLKQKEQRREDKKNSAIKGEKVVFISSNISEHDLEIQAKKISKLVAKQYEVRIVINGNSSDMEKAENLFSLLENYLKTSGRIIQKRQKGSDIKFQILPLKKTKDNMKGDSENSGS